MFALYKKELSGFFSSLIGYLTIAVFLVLSGLMLWVFRSDFNILDYGFANMDGLFLIGPFLYLFLIPAITMRMIAEEKRVGTMELLLTKPISEMTLICSKFLAGITLVFISLLPTLVCYFSVYFMGDPVGNIDSGSVFGSYVGLLLLGCAFVAIGIFASAFTSNQIVSFITAAALCAFAYLGFESLYYMDFLGDAGLFVKSLGIRHHYESISRGVIDTRDVLYFISVVVLFLMATRLVLQSRKWSGWLKNKNVRRDNWFELAATILIIIFINVIGYYLFARLDLTAERRYTLSKPTKEMLKKIDEPVLFRVYLEGDFPSDFKRLHDEAKEMLNQFRAYNKNVQYEFVNPNDFDNEQDRQVFYRKLIDKGIRPTSIQVKTDDGVATQVLIPAADVVYKGQETSVELIQNQQYVSDADLLNNSVQNLEYVFSNAIRLLAQPHKPQIGFSIGHGELNGPVLYDIQMTLQQNYSLDTVRLNGNVNALTIRDLKADSSFSLRNKYDLLIVAKPTQPFDDRDLFVLDQFVMYGGKILWLVDALDADNDSLAHQSQAISTRLPLNLDDMFFTYGVRVNPNLIMDLRCRPIPMAVGMVGDKPQIKFSPWFYFPDIVPMSQHPIVRNLDIIKTDFVSSIDLIECEGIVQTPLLVTSEYSRIKNAPVVISLADSREEPDQRLYTRSNLPIAVLLEGEFRSMWRNRLAPEFTAIPAMGFKEKSLPTKMIVISDGDIIRNRFSPNEGPDPLGYDHYTHTQYANREFLMNCVDFLCGDDGVMDCRTRDIKLRKLNVVKVKENRTVCQMLNIVLPVALLLLVGVAAFVLRKRKYTLTH